MNMNKGSMIDYAIAILTTQKAMTFAELWAKVKEELEITPEEEADRIGHFYTDLSLSGQTILLPGNVWDLRQRHTFDELTLNKDVSDVYSAIEEKDQDEADAQDEKEYNESVQGKAVLSDDEEPMDEGEEDSEKGNEDQEVAESYVHGIR
ncbi:MAG: DNA-directed RNA polymerase subunit delta [Mollicutes bacterium]|nr:DNA-directed RNA polymerase subunit delta [bacterium]MDD6801530.1 DNA-directed RNA polymerase subunit delta [Mollicutes bacterium]MDD7064680.1 DNA-directed RNA polymerase subunit delta [Mollicutes bacterium]MDY2687820.1 DNA-directed RNA polymerase subunit delta [Candidatus Enteromonas sp.]MDY5298457.1 DNA-directed RNA polymerase subunit delta [Candidatus Enteromonas sp.]